MNDLEQHFKKATEHIRMTDSEKSAMHVQLVRVMQDERAPRSLAAPSRSLGEGRGEVGYIKSPYVWMFAPRSLAMLGVALLVVLSTGSAYASESSLPGTPLYSVKTKIVEPLKIALAPTVEAKAQANANIAATRVQEAQTLAAQGTLTSQVVQEISDSYNSHAKAALALAADVEAREGGHDDFDNSENDTAVDITVAAVEIESEESEPGSAGVVSIRATAPMALSVRIEATSSEDMNDSEVSSDSNTRKATFAAYSTSKKAASTTRPAEMNATTTETTRKNNSRNFVRMLRASLSAQAEILQQLDVQVRSGKGGRGDE